MGVNLTNCYRNNNEPSKGEEEENEDEIPQIARKKKPKNVDDKILAGPNLKHEDLENEIVKERLKCLYDTEDSSTDKRKDQQVEQINFRSNKNKTKFQTNSNSRENDENKFFTLDNAHRQTSTLSKSFKTINNKSLNKQLDDLLDNEMEKNKTEFPKIQFSVEAIIERNPNNYITESYGRINLSENKKNDKSTESNDSAKYVESSSDSKTSKSFSNSQSSGATSFKFHVVSNIFFYDCEFSYKENLLVLRRKVNLIAIDFLSITPDHKRLIIHINKFLDSNGGNICLLNDNSLQIAYCLCNLIYISYSMIKWLVVIPKSVQFFELVRKISSYDKLVEMYNAYSDEMFQKINKILPFDYNEHLLKIVPLSKFENKFTDGKSDTILILTNKKLIEMSSEKVETSKMSIISLPKMMKINEYSQMGKFQIITEDGTTFQYSTIYMKKLIRWIYFTHSKESLVSLELNKIS